MALVENLVAGVGVQVGSGESSVGPVAVVAAKDLFGSVEDGLHGVPVIGDLRILCREVPKR